MKALVNILLIIALLPARGQGNKVVGKLQKEGSEWNVGTLFLKNEAVLKGQVQYNDKNGTLAIKTGEGSESYSANTVFKFNFFDEGMNAHRNFISLDYPFENLKKGTVSSYSLTNSDARGKTIVPTFFEVLKEANEFVILSKMKPIEYKENAKRYGVRSGGIMIGGSIVYDEVKQNEILFFLNHEGEIIPYIEFTNKETINVSFGNERKSTKKRKIDPDLLEEVTGELYPRLMEYAKANSLKTTRRKDLLIIIDHYISLQAQNKK
jgi:hypothetical protein